MQLSLKEYMHQNKKKALLKGCTAKLSKLFKLCPKDKASCLAPKKQLSEAYHEYLQPDSKKTLAVIADKQQPSKKKIRKNKDAQPG